MLENLPFFTIGHETSTVTLTWAILLLSKHPEFQERAREEIRSVLNGEKQITSDHLQNMKFLDNCIKETMRLYPVAVQVSRQAKEDVKIGPYEIPKGTIVFAGAACAHRDLEFWEDTDKFNPDRFDELGMLNYVCLENLLHNPNESRYLGKDKFFISFGCNTVCFILP